MQPARFLVTGGSQGIGAAVVELASKAGHQVVFTGRNEALIETIAREDRRAWPPGRRICRATTMPGPSTRAWSAWAE